MSDKRVLTFQDISCIGQCSLTVALPIISACGIETVILPSAVLSSHTGGFKGYTFHDLTEDIPGIISHWESEKLKFDCLYTGYLGSIAQIDYVTNIKNSVLKDGAPLIVDPAMADFGRLYAGFDSEFVKAMANLCQKADIILPNITEAAFITGKDAVLDNHSQDYILDIINALLDLGAKKVILKGINFNDNEIGIAYCDSSTRSIKYYFTEKIGKASHGTGDCYASAFTGALMHGMDELSAASIAADFVVESIKKTIDDDSHWYGVKFEKALPMLVSKLNK